MHYIKSPKTWFLLLLGLIALIGIPLAYYYTTQAFASGSLPCGKQTIYGGTVLSIAPHVVKTHNPRERQTNSVSMVVTVDDATHFYRQQGKSCQEVKFSDLQVGQNLKVFSRYDMVIAVYPVPITASAVVIVG
ncbi:MAG: hypothetical protein E6J34_13525 [Chloroflexi bacterium]|nr:MAG: hypothetical protein E6J34_13525 [Chloroflexota bacterium]